MRQICKVCVCVSVPPSPWALGVSTANSHGKWVRASDLLARLASLEKIIIRLLIVYKIQTNRLAILLLLPDNIVIYTH